MIYVSVEVYYANSNMFNLIIMQMCFENKMGIMRGPL